MSKRESTLLVEDIINSGTKILQYTHELSFEKFLEDDKTIDAVVRNFEIIGEAANHLPDDFKGRHHDIDWNRIRGLRNRIVHNYFGIDYAIVWEIKISFLPDIIDKLKSILP